MTRNAKVANRGQRVLLVAPKVPPYGGMAIQAGLMQKLLNQEGISAAFLASNLPFPPVLAFCERIRGARPFLRSMVFCRELWKMLRDADVVHILACSWLYFFVIVSPAVAISRLRGKRIVLNYRGGEADHFFRWYAPFAKVFFRMADVVTAPSKFLVEVIGRRIRVPVEIVPNIIDFTIFPYRERKPLKPKMIVTRHLLKLYDIESVIRAFGEVQRRYPEASLLIVGTGHQESNLRSLVASMGLKNVQFLGYVAQRDLPPVYDQCDILLNASRADNFPGSLVEAAASGLVVISTGVGGIPYIFENGKSALLVAPGDWRGLAHAALRVLEDQNLAASLAREALQQCLQYDWKNVRQVLYRMYGFKDAFEASSQYEQSPDQVVAVGEAGAQ
jgi:glycosyltransferase involved in cell wall biosynthesis